jgi:hypothetical protein
MRTSDAVRNSKRAFPAVMVVVPAVFAAWQVSAGTPAISSHHAAAIRGEQRVHMRDCDYR